MINELCRIRAVLINIMTFQHSITHDLGCELPWSPLQVLVYPGKDFLETSIDVVF